MSDIIDMHAHAVPGDFPQHPAAPKGWPSMAPGGPHQGNVMIDGAIYRTVADTCWDVPRRLAALDASGITHQAISPMPELFSTWMAPVDAALLLRHINDRIAAMVADSSGRLIGLGALPMQDLALAETELRRLRAQNFAGVEIGSNVNGTVIGDPSLDRFFAVAAELDMAVLVHPVRPAGMDRLVGPKNLQQALAYPSEIGLAAASVITGGLLTRHPTLRLCFSHGGGTLLTLLARLEQAWKTFPALRQSMPESPMQQVRHLYVDALVFDGPLLERLIAVLGEDRILLGTDMPFAFREDDPAGRVAETVPPGVARDAITAGNARRFLGLHG